MTRPTSIFSSSPTTSMKVGEPLNTIGGNTPTVVNNKLPSIVQSITEDAIVNLGVDSGKSISTMASQLLELHKGSDQGEMGTKLDDLIKGTKNLSAENFKQGKVRSVINKVLNLKEDVILRFEDAKTKVDKLVQGLEAEKAKQKKVYENTNNLIQANALYCKSLMDEIEQGKQMLEAIASEIEALDVETDMSVEQSRALATAKDRYDLLEKKIVDLESFKVLSINMDPKLNAMKSSVHSLITTFDMIVGKMIPAYMLYFDDYLNGLAAERGAALSNKAIDTFDELIKASGDQAVKNFETIGRLKNRQLVSVDTIKQEHEKMVQGLNNLRTIEDQARKDRAQAVITLQAIEQESIKAFSHKGN